MPADYPNALQFIRHDLKHNKFECTKRYEHVRIYEKNKINSLIGG